MEVSSGLSPITARSRGNLPNLVTPMRNVSLLLRLVRTALYFRRRQIKPSNLGVTIRHQYHINQNIHLVSSHPYVSPFMLIQPSSCLLVHNDVSPFMSTLIKQAQVGYYCLELSFK
jgi:hypothetical protein